MHAERLYNGPSSQGEKHPRTAELGSAQADNE